MAKRSARTPAAPPAVPVPTNTEVEAYGFIRSRLGDAGWKVNDPTRNRGGQVWTQNQCLTHAVMKRAFGTQRPENVVKVAEQSIWVIEAKAKRKELAKAVAEACDYSKLVNDLGEPFRAVFATGVAGNEHDGYDVSTVVRIGSEWKAVTINGQEATGFLSPADTSYLLERGGFDVRDFAPSQLVFLRAATRINEILHNGGIEHNERAKTIAALLLAVLEK